MRESTAFRRGFLALAWCVLCGATLPEEARVVRIIDGDTVELEDGERLRYLGIDTPEMTRREEGKWIKDPEPFAEAAKQRNGELVLRQTVRLEFDKRPRDRYGRLLAYVYRDGTMVNTVLLEEGLAEVMIISPNRRHAEEFRRIELEAQERGVGIWAE